MSDARSHDSDYRLVRAALRRDRSAVAQLVERMHCVPRMVSARNKRMGAPLRSAELDDVVQDCLMAIWRKLDTYDGLAKLETWAFRFCFLEVFKKLRTENRFPDLFTDDAEARLADAPDVSLHRELEYEHVYRALEELDAGQEELIRLKHFEGLSFTEIAARKDVAASTVKTRYYQALFRLRARLSELEEPRRARGEG